MSKALLILDMPKSCDECEFVDEQYHYCSIPWFGKDVSDYVECRHEECPLRECPKKIGAEEALKMPRNANLADVINSYNTCIDGILGK